jgi:hypothetical protein
MKNCEPIVNKMETCVPILKQMKTCAPIDWCLMPTLVIFQLYPGIIFLVNNALE